MAFNESNISEADILRQLEVQGVGARPDEVYKTILSEISESIVKDFKEQIKKTTKGSGALAQSVVAIPQSNGFEIQADAYYKYIDEGVDGAPNRTDLNYIRPIVRGTPHKFRNLGTSKGMIKSLRSTVSGSLSQVYAVAVSIKKHGIKPKHITDDVITDALLERIAEDLATVTGLAVEAVWNKHTPE